MVTQPKEDEEDSSRDPDQEDTESKQLRETSALLMQEQSQGSSSQLAPTGGPAPGIRKLSMAASSISEGRSHPFFLSKQQQAFVKASLPHFS